MAGRILLAILPPSMPTFLASKELCRRFVTASCLEKPPECRVMSAFWAVNICGWHRLDLFFLLSNYLYLRGTLLSYVGRARDARLGFFSEAAFLADNYWCGFLLFES